MTKIGVALSGGVDSSLAALLLRDQGYEVIAVTLKVQDDQEGSNVCAGDSAVEKARQTASFLGIEHHVCDVSADFKRLILKYACDEYARARTPSPCVRCNEWIKFGRLVPFCLELGCTHMATGHYAQIVDYAGKKCIARGADVRKDQSYFLSGLPSSILEHVMFPLGGYEKTQVRALAEHYALPSAKAADSQNVCITRPGQTFAETLWDIFRMPVHLGRFVVDGKLAGQHEGLHRYTVGQRHGLGNLAPARPVWVSHVGPDNVDVTTNGRTLDTRVVEAADVFWNVDSVPTRCSAQIRYRHQAVMGTLEKLGDRIRMTFDEPVHAATPGQTLVFYDGNVVLGRGWLVDGNAL